MSNRPTAELRNTLQADCWEAGGRQLPSYITALTASSADGGGKGLGARAGKNVNRNETKKERKAERVGEGDDEREQRGLKNTSNWEGGVTVM